MALIPWMIRKVTGDIHRNVPVIGPIARGLKPGDVPDEGLLRLTSRSIIGWPPAPAPIAPHEYNAFHMRAGGVAPAVSAPAASSSAGVISPVARRGAAVVPPAPAARVMTDAERIQAGMANTAAQKEITAYGKSADTWIEGQRKLFDDVNNRSALPTAEFHGHYKGYVTKQLAERPGITEAAARESGLIDAWINEAHEATRTQAYGTLQQAEELHGNYKRVLDTAANHPSPAEELARHKDLLRDLEKQRAPITTTLTEIKAGKASSLAKESGTVLEFLGKNKGGVALAGAAVAAGAFALHEHNENRHWRDRIEAERAQRGAGGPPPLG